MENQTFADITAEQIQDWKAKYGKNSLSQVTVTTEDGDVHHFILRKPGRNPIHAAQKTGVSIEAANKIMLANCLLAGDEKLFDQDVSIYAAVIDEIGKLVKSAKVSVKKI